MKSKKILSLLLVAVFSCQTATVYADEGDGYQADEISEEQIYEKELPKFSIEDMNLIIGEQRYFYALPDDLNLQENELKVTVEDEAVVKIQIAAPESLEADIKDGVPENAQWYCAIGISQGETMICIQMGNKEKKIPVIVSGQEGDSEEKNEKNTEEGQIDGEAITKDKIAENTYNTFSVQTGWTEREGKKYYINGNGEACKGITKIEGVLYYFDENTGALTESAGWIDINGSRYFCNEEGKLYNRQFIKFGNIYYYMGADGSLQKGIFQADGKKYYADPATGQVNLKAGWIEDSGKRYFANEEGILYINQFIKFGSIYHYLGDDGSEQKGTFEVQGKKYHANSATGEIKLEAGWIEDDGKRYYADEEGVLYANQFIRFGNIYYYMGDDGSVQKGTFGANGKKYHANSDTGQIKLEAGWIEDNGKKYYSYGGGEIFYSQFISFGAISYYMGADGSIQKGVIQTGDKVYYADESTGQIQKKVGWIDSGGKRYFSNEAGILYSSQFISFGAVTYYMGNDGSLQKGIIQTGGKLYYADESTGQIQKKAGWIESGGKKYYSNEAGVLYSSQFISFGSNCYYMGADGSMQKGKQYINGKWYYFDEETGLMIRSTGWFSSGPNRYYQKSDGTLAIGYTDIDNIRYYFNSSGVLASKMGIDVSQWQGNIDWRKVKEAGVEFAFIRVGYRGSASGNLAADPYYKQNIEGALAAGIKVGVYFFSQATTVQEAREEASYTYNLIKNYNITYPVAFDTEYYDSAHSGRADKLSASTRTLLANIFCSEIRNYGYTAMIYSGTYFMNNNLQMSLLTNCLVWVAQYNKELQYKGTYKCWQYSSSGRVNGINGNVDMNVWIN